MISLNSRVAVTLFKIYVAVAVIVAIIGSPLALSFVPILLLVWYFVLWRWFTNAVLNLLTEYFMFFAIALLFNSFVGPVFALIISLPVLLLVNHRLKKAAESPKFKDARYARQPTAICLNLFLVAIAGMFVSWLVGSLSLLLACVAAIICFGIMGAVIFTRLPSKPVEEETVHQRIVAGTEGHLYIKLRPKTRIGGLLFLESPYEWLKVSPGILPLKEKELLVKVSLSPELSGTSVIKLKGKAVDRWGLFQFSFEIAPIRLYIIPRARYAAWLATRYLAGTKSGAIPLISDTEVRKLTPGRRGGVEYYGNQVYQPGDSLKDISWKHTIKLNELITKEYAGFYGCPAVILINLAVSNAGEADKLAYDIIATALTLAQENIPAALAAYNHEAVKITTPALNPRQLVFQSLQIAQEMVMFVNPLKYLNPPNVARLRANISRVRFIESRAARVLAQLLQLEYENLSDGVKLHPATKALADVFNKTDKQSNIVIISHRNHDAETLAFHTFSLARKGNMVINTSTVKEGM